MLQWGPGDTSFCILFWKVVIYYSVGEEHVHTEQ